MKTVCLGEVAKFIRGVTYKPGDVVDGNTPDAVGVVRTKNVQRDLDLDDVIYIPSRLVRRDDQLVRIGDILISSANSWSLVGKCCWVPHLAGTYAIGGFVTGLRVTCTEVHPRYVYRWLATPHVQAALRNTANQTTNIANLNLRRCEKLPLPLPPPDEQRRIAAILDHAEAMQFARRESLRGFDELAVSIFSTMFGDPTNPLESYPVVRLSDCIQPERPITYGILKPGPDVEQGVPYVRVADMKGGGIDITAVRRTTAAIAKEYKRSTLRHGDLLMSIRGHVGRFAFVPQELDGANITQDSARLAVRDSISAVYLRAAMEMPGLQQWMVRHTKGVAVRGINLGDLRDLPIPLPPQAAQRRFERAMIQVDQERQAAGRQLNHLQDLFASLESQAFAGQL